METKRILKAARESKLVTYKEALIRMSADISTGILQTRRNWHEIFSDEKQRATTKITQQSYLESRDRYKSFLEKKMLKEFITTKPVLQEM